jgi:hypothetical protein
MPGNREFTSPFVFVTVSTNGNVLMVFLFPFLDLAAAGLARARVSKLKSSVTIPEHGVDTLQSWPEYV